VRAALPLLAALVAIGLVGCDGDNEETTVPAPRAQRFVTAEDAPGSKPDPVEKRETTTNFDTFLSALGDSSIDPDTDELKTVFDDAAFVSAGQDARFFGESHSPETSVHVFSSFIELGSDDAATGALDWLETDQLKPCPRSCAVQRSSFEVDDIPGARGVHRVATAEDIERVGTKDEVPQDDYWIGFAIGPIVYTVVLHGHGVPGTVSQDQAQEIASAYYDRLTS
jgi:hypothetical protein